MNDDSVLDDIVPPLSGDPSPLPLRGLPYYIEPDPRASGAFQGPSRYFALPCESKPTKRFIYGDTWNAYQRI